MNKGEINLKVIGLNFFIQVTEIKDYLQYEWGLLGAPGPKKSL